MCVYAAGHQEQQARLGSVLSLERYKVMCYVINLSTTCLYSVSHKTKIDKKVAKWLEHFGQTLQQNTHTFTK